MKITTLNERIEKAEATIAKKETTIEKKTARIEKKEAELARLGYPEYTLEAYREEREKMDKELANTLYWTLCDIKNLKEDIARGRKEIEEKKITLENYKKQLAGELERESILLNEIPEVFNPYRDMLVESWNEWDKARRERLQKAYKELGYEGFMRKYHYSDYEFRYITDEQINDANTTDARNLILNLYYRVKDITGEVTSWEDLHVTSGNMGAVINGYVEGKEGRAKVESVLAGGYNIQKLHIRVLVHEY